MIFGRKGKMGRREELLAELAELDAKSEDKDALRRLMSVWGDFMCHVLWGDRKEDEERQVGKTEEMISRGLKTLHEVMEIDCIDLR